MPRNGSRGTGEEVEVMPEEQGGGRCAHFSIADRELFQVSCDVPSHMLSSLLQLPTPPRDCRANEMLQISAALNRGVWHPLRWQVWQG